MVRRTVRLLAALVIGFSMTSTVHASPIVVDLEAFTDGEALTTQIPGFLFSNAAILTAGVSLNEFEFPPASGVNVAFDSGGAMRVDFLSPLGGFGAQFTYLVPVVLEAFDAGNNSLGTVSSAFASNLALSGDPGSSPNEFLEVAFAGMAYVTITGNALGASFAVDNLVLTPAAPEPTIQALFLFGASALSARVRWRRRIDRRD